MLLNFKTTGRAGTENPFSVLQPGIYFPVPLGNHLRELGLLKDQKGILNRYFREGLAWHPHLDHTRDFIIRWLETMSGKELLVLGSGWLLDFPLDEAVRFCSGITLADIHHPPQVLKRIAKYPGTRCITADITGGLLEEIAVLRKQGHKGSEGIDRILSGFHPVYQVPPGTIVLSLNILSQIDSLLTDALPQGFFRDDKHKLVFRKFIQEEHIRMLMHHNFCLVADYAEVIKNSGGEISTVKEHLFCSLPGSGFQEEWIWDFDLSGSYHKGHMTLLKVGAMTYQQP